MLPGIVSGILGALSGVPPTYIGIGPLGSEASANADDIVLAVSVTTGSFKSAAGAWTRFLTGTSPSGLKVAIFWKKATASGTGYSSDYGTASTLADYFVVTRGANLSSPIDASAVGSTATNTSAVFPDITLTGPAFVLLVGVNDNVRTMSSEANSNLTGITERLDLGATLGTVGLTIVTATAVSGGAIGTSSGVLSASVGHLEFSVGVKPA